MQGGKVRRSPRNYGAEKILGETAVSADSPGSLPLKEKRSTGPGFELQDLGPAGITQSAALFRSRNAGLNIGAPGAALPVVFDVKIDMVNDLPQGAQWAVIRAVGAIMQRIAQDENQLVQHRCMGTPGNGLDLGKKYFWRLAMHESLLGAGIICT